MRAARLAKEMIRSLINPEVEEATMNTLVATMEAKKDSGELTLLDGGASHDVYVCPTQDAIRGTPKEVHLAHGTRDAFVDADEGRVTFLDKEATEEESRTPKILSLGRLFKKLKLELTWSEKEASLKLPNGNLIPLRIENLCPHVSKKSLTYILGMVEIQDKAKRRFLEKGRHLADRLKSIGNRLTLRLRLRTKAEVNRHRRNGHKQYSKDCPECLRGTGGSRPHHRLARPQGGELSIDISGPFNEGITPTDRPVTEADRPQYILVGAFTPFAQ